VTLDLPGYRKGGVASTPTSPTLAAAIWTAEAASSFLSSEEGVFVLDFAEEACILHSFGFSFYSFPGGIFLIGAREFRVQGRLRIFMQESREEIRLEVGETYSIMPRRPHLVTDGSEGSVSFLMLNGVGGYDLVPLLEKDAH
jgi:hypothetical protein